MKKIGIDLGGTNMRLGVADGDVIERKKIVPCPSHGSAEEVIEALCALIDKYITPEVAGIGVGVPTLVDAEKGIVFNATNIPSWREVHLKDILTKRYGVRTEVNNDANCFVLGEALYGAGRGRQSVVGVTLGTGVGGGIVIDGKLYCGRNTGAAEVGELPFRERNFEYYCSSEYFVREHGTTGKEAAAAALAGDVKAQQIWVEYGANVGELMKAVMFAYDPEIIVVGGGISTAYNLFKDAMMKTLATFPYPESLRNISIEPATLTDVAILGASALV